MRVLFATSSAGKLREGRALLAPAGIELVGLADLGVRAEVEERAGDYVGNARLKARDAAAGSGLAALADDSGLEVDALGGEPGVRSARWGGPGLDDAARNARLLAALAGVEPDARGARFVCVLVLVDPSGEDVAVARGERRGRIAVAPRGSLGFGYDPVFELAPGGPTFAELDPTGKDRESHRGRAFRALGRVLGERSRGRRGGG